MTSDKFKHTSGYELIGELNKRGYRQDQMLLYSGDVRHEGEFELTKHARDEELVRKARSILKGHESPGNNALDDSLGPEGKHVSIGGPLILPITETIFAVRREFMLSNMITWMAAILNLLEPWTRGGVVNIPDAIMQKIRAKVPPDEYMGSDASHTTGQIDKAVAVNLLHQYLQRRGEEPSWFSREEKLWADVYSTPGTITVATDFLLHSVEDTIRCIQHEKRHFAITILPQEARSLLSKVAKEFLRSHSLGGVIEKVKKRYQAKKRVVELLAIMSLHPANIFGSVLQREGFNWKATGIPKKRKPEILEAMESLHKAGKATEDERQAVIHAREELRKRIGSVEPVPTAAPAVGEVSAKDIRKALAHHGIRREEAGMLKGKIGRPRAPAAPPPPKKDPDGNADILEPLTRPNETIRSRWEKTLYYLEIGAWEEVLFRGGAWIGLPRLLNGVHAHSGVTMAMGSLWSGPVFLFAHTIVRWLVLRQKGGWEGWGAELKKDFLGRRLIAVALFNMPFLLGPFCPSVPLIPSPGGAVLVAALIHAVWDPFNAPDAAPTITSPPAAPPGLVGPALAHGARSATVEILTLDVKDSNPEALKQLTEGERAELVRQVSAWWSESPARALGIGTAIGTKPVKVVFHRVEEAPWRIVVESVSSGPDLSEALTEPIELGAEPPKALPARSPVALPRLSVEPEVEAREAIALLRQHPAEPVRVAMLRRLRALIAQHPQRIHDALRQGEEDVLLYLDGMRMSETDPRYVLADFSRPQQAVAAYARRLGFDAQTAAALNLGAQELLYNIFKYADFGVVIVQTGRKDSRPCLEVVSYDLGNGGLGIIDIAQAVHARDRQGTGLAGLSRVADQLVIESEGRRWPEMTESPVHQGTAIVAQKWFSNVTPAPAAAPGPGGAGPGHLAPPDEEPGGSRKPRMGPFLPRGQQPGWLGMLWDHQPVRFKPPDEPKKPAAAPQDPRRVIQSTREMYGSAFHVRRILLRASAQSPDPWLLIRFFALNRNFQQLEGGVTVSSERAPRAGFQRLISDPMLQEQAALVKARLPFLFDDGITYRRTRSVQRPELLTGPAHSYRTLERRPDGQQGLGEVVLTDLTAREVRWIRKEFSRRLGRPITPGLLEAILRQAVLHEFGEVLYRSLPAELKAQFYSVVHHAGFIADPLRQKETASASEPLAALLGADPWADIFADYWSLYIDPKTWLSDYERLNHEQEAYFERVIGYFTQQHERYGNAFFIPAANPGPERGDSGPGDGQTARRQQIQEFLEKTFPQLTKGLIRGKAPSQTQQRLWLGKLTEIDPELSRLLGTWFKAAEQRDGETMGVRWQAFADILHLEYDLLCLLYVTYEQKLPTVQGILGRPLLDQRRVFRDRASGKTVVVDVIRPAYQTPLKPAGAAIPSVNYVWMSEEQVDTAIKYRKILSEELQHMYDYWHPIQEINDPKHGRLKVKTGRETDYWSEVAAFLVKMADPLIPTLEILDEVINFATLHDLLLYIVITQSGLQPNPAILRAASSDRVVALLSHFTPEVSSTSTKERHFDYDLLRQTLTEKGASSIQALAIFVYHQLFGKDRSTWEREFVEINPAGKGLDSAAAPAANNKYSVEERIAKIDELMTAIENEIAGENDDQYTATVGGNRPYAGTWPKYGERVIRDLQGKGLMEPNGKFGDIGAGIGRMLAMAVALTDVGEAVGFEADPYLVKKGQKAIDQLHDMGVLDKSKIRWVQGRWQAAGKEIADLTAAYAYPSMKSYDFEPWGEEVRRYMRSDAYLVDATNIASGTGMRPAAAAPAGRPGSGRPKALVAALAALSSLLIPLTTWAATGPDSHSADLAARVLGGIVLLYMAVLVVRMLVGIVAVIRRYRQERAKAQGTKSISQERIDRMAEFLKRYPNENIIGLFIYGSVAKDTARQQSDLDYLPIRRTGAFFALNDEDMEFEIKVSQKFSFIEHSTSLPLILESPIEGRRHQYLDEAIALLFMPPHPQSAQVRGVRPGDAFVKNWLVVARTPESQRQLTRLIQERIQAVGSSAAAPDGGEIVFGFTLLPGLSQLLIGAWRRLSPSRFLQLHSHKDAWRPKHRTLRTLGIREKDLPMGTLLFWPERDYMSGPNMEGLSLNTLKPQGVPSRPIIPLVATGLFRGIDGAGSSLDLPRGFRELKNPNARGLARFSSTPTFASRYGFKVRFEPADDPNINEYIAPMYGVRERYRTDTPLGAKGAVPQRHATEFVFRLFGLRGIRVTVEEIDSRALPGGMGTSGAINLTLVEAASVLSGANLSQAEIINLTVRLETAEFGGVTGGQEAISTLLGGGYWHIWLSGLKDEFGDFPQGFLSIPISPERLTEMSQHALLIQVGKEFRNGAAVTKRTASQTNQVWTDLLNDNDPVGVAYHVENIRLTAEWVSAIMKGDFVRAGQALDRYVDNRDSTTKHWINLMLDAHAGRRALPAYAYVYEQRVFHPHNDQEKERYGIFKELFDEHGEGLRNISLYSLDPITAEIKKAREQGIALFPLGAGGAGATCLAWDPIGVGHAKQEFFTSGRGYGELTPEIAEAAMTRAGRHMLKGYTEFQVGVEPFRLESAVPGLERPRGPIVMGKARMLRMSAVGLDSERSSLGISQLLSSGFWKFRMRQFISAWQWIRQKISRAGDEAPQRRPAVPATEAIPPMTATEAVEFLKDRLPAYEPPSEYILRDLKPGQRSLFIGDFGSLLIPAHLLMGLDVKVLSGYKSNIRVVQNTCGDPRLRDEINKRNRILSADRADIRSAFKIIPLGDRYDHVIALQWGQLLPPRRHEKLLDEAFAIVDRFPGFLEKWAGEPIGRAIAIYLGFFERPRFEPGLEDEQAFIIWKFIGDRLRPGGTLLAGLEPEHARSVFNYLRSRRIQFTETGPLPKSLIGLPAQDAKFYSPVWLLEIRGIESSSPRSMGGAASPRRPSDGERRRNPPFFQPLLRAA